MRSAGKQSQASEKSRCEAAAEDAATDVCACGDVDAVANEDVADAEGVRGLRPGFAHSSGGRVVDVVTGCAGFVGDGWTVVSVATSSQSSLRVRVNDVVGGCAGFVGASRTVVPVATSSSSSLSS